jgi:hypothetical protein
MVVLAHSALYQDRPASLTAEVFFNFSCGADVLAALALGITFVFLFFFGITDSGVSF